MNDFWKSKVIKERFEFIEELGKGGIGTVILARDRTLDKEVAIKILNANLSDEESIRFQQEGILSGRLRHENIVAVLDFGVTDTNIPYLIMERLTGVSLAHMLREEGALDTMFSIQVFQQICRGMRSSHNQGVVHRDLKPANVIMVPNEDQSFSAKIVDFGLARLSERDERLTAPGSAIGSPLYMSPEQGQGLPGDERSDIYSMGCLMYEVLTGSVPFSGDTAVMTLMMHQSVTPEKLQVRAQQPFPPKLEHIVANCLKKLPEERYQSFNDLLEDLEHLEAEIIHDERQQFYESRSRSGIQKALGSVTDYGMPLAGNLSNNETVLRTMIALSTCAILVCTALLLTPILNKNLKDVVPSQEPVAAFGDTLDTFVTMKEHNNNGKITIEGFQSNNDKDLQKLRQYQHIESLEIGGSACEGYGLKFLKGTTTISNIDMHGDYPTAVGLAAVADVDGLKGLSLNDCDEMQDSNLAILAQSETLEQLSFGGELLTEGSFKYLKTYPALQSVSLDEFKVTTAGMSELLKIPKLQSLNFNECKLGPGVLEQLSKIEKPLFNFELSSDYEITNAIVTQLEKAKTRNITLRDVTTTGSTFARFRNDKRYLWTELKVDGKLVPSR